tara:strand:+ start:123 stop:269 length:147 start_codon:yes stop_codon:yes gene_type:complete
MKVMAEKVKIAGKEHSRQRIAEINSAGTENRRHREYIYEMIKDSHDVL